MGTRKARQVTLFASAEDLQESCTELPVPILRA